MRCLFSVVGVLVAISAAGAQETGSDSGEVFVKEGAHWKLVPGKEPAPGPEGMFWNYYTRGDAVQRYGELLVSQFEAQYGPRGASFNILYMMRVADRYGIPLEHQKQMLELTKNTCALCQLHTYNPNKITGPQGCLGTNCGVVQRILDRYKLGQLPFMQTAKDQEVKPGFGTAVKQQAIGVGIYGLAYALKGVIRAVVNWDWNELEVHAYQMKQPGFWGSAILFGAASQTTQTIVQAAASRLPANVVKALPTAAAGAGKLALGGASMAVGMALVQYAQTGQVSLKDLAIATGSYMIAGVGVNLLLDAVTLAVLGATPAGWVYIVAKLALTLYFGEQLDSLIRSWLQGLPEKLERARVWFQGIKEKIDAIKPALGAELQE